MIAQLNRRLTWLGWIGGAVGAVVIFLAIGFLIPVFIDPGERGDLALLNAPLIVLYVVVVGGLLTRHAARHLARTLAWVEEGREPDEDEHRQTLGLANYALRLYGAAWLVAGALFSLLNGLEQGWAFAAVVAGTIWLGGETTCALDYLVTEHVLRPVTALALAARQPDDAVAPGVRARLLTAWALGTGAPLVGVLVVGVVGVTRSRASTPSTSPRPWSSSSWWRSPPACSPPCWRRGRSPTPSRRCARGSRGSSAASCRRAWPSTTAARSASSRPASTGWPRGCASASGSATCSGARSARTWRGRRSATGPPSAARSARSARCSSTSSARPRWRWQNPPAEVVRVLNRFFQVVVDVTEREGGLVNKFEGDAALCVFGAPVRRDDPAGDALRCARTLAERLAREVPEVDFGIGVSAGTAVAGNVGAEHRFEYTVIGDPVNEAARLCTLAKQRPERVLASHEALERASAEERGAWSGDESAVLDGRDAPTLIATPCSAAGRPSRPAAATPRRAT